MTEATVTGKSDHSSGLSRLLGLHDLLIKEFGDVLEVVRFGNRVVMRSVWKILPEFLFGRTNAKQLFHMRGTASI